MNASWLCTRGVGASIAIRVDRSIGRKAEATTAAQRTIAINRSQRVELAAEPSVGGSAFDCFRPATTSAPPTSMSKPEAAGKESPVLDRADTMTNCLSRSGIANAMNAMTKRATPMRSIRLVVMLTIQWVVISVVSLGFGVT